MSTIRVKLTFVGSPKIIDVRKIIIMVISFELVLVLVVYFAEPMELIHPPVALISQLTIRVVQVALAIHQVIPPVSLIHTSLLVVKFAKTISHSVMFLPLIPAGLVLLHNILILFLAVSGA